MPDALVDWVQTLAPPEAHAYADLLLYMHWCVVLLAVLPVPLFWIGGVKNWRWVRCPVVRFSHLGLIGYIVINTLLGHLCPLTVWENTLRLRAGQAGHSEDGLIADWLHNALYVSAPPIVFMAAYGVFGCLVIFLWWRYPPRRKNMDNNMSS